jgi:hypothetical protein
MRHFQYAGALVFCLLLSINASAQFNVNSLFAPIDFRLHLNLYESLAGNSNRSFVSLPPIDSSVLLEDNDAWKNWSYVENYEFGNDRGSIPMITDLNSLHPFFRDQVTTLIAKCKAKGIELAIVETYRTHAKQHEYKSMGGDYTTAKAGQSRHQYGLAVDVVPIVNSKPVWKNASLWKKIGIVGEKLGLRWGGRWKNPYDPGHFEWTGGLTSRHLSAGKFPTRADFAERYPCLDDDLRLLQTYWSEWETSQSAWTRR